MHGVDGTISWVMVSRYWYAAAPGFYSRNWLFIGKCYLRLGKKADAKEWLQKTASHTIDNNDDKEVRPSLVSLL